MKRKKLKRTPLKGGDRVYSTTLDRKGLVVGVTGGFGDVAIVRLDGDEDATWFMSSGLRRLVRKKKPASTPPRREWKLYKDTRYPIAVNGPMLAADEMACVTELRPGEMIVTEEMLRNAWDAHVADDYFAASNESAAFLDFFRSLKERA